MRHYTTVSVAIFAAFICWCALSLSADITPLSFALLWRSRDVVLLAMILTMFGYVLRALRWKWYLHRFGHTLTLSFSTLTYVAGFAFTLVPGRLGELFRARYYTGLGIPLRDVAAAFCVERLMDLMALLVLASLVASAFPYYDGAIWAAVVASVVSIVSLATLPWDAVAHSFASSSRIPRALARAGAGAASALAAARLLLSPKTAFFGFLIALAAWGLEGVGLRVLCSIFMPLRVDTPVAIGIYGVAVLLGTLSFLPGGLGSTEAVMTALLATRGYSIGTSLLITVTYRIVTLWLGVCVGWMAVIILRYGWPRHDGAVPRTSGSLTPGTLRGSGRQRDW